MIDNTKNKALAQLRALFYRHPRHEELEEQFTRLLKRRRIEAMNGLRSEARGIALIGTSGSGKTTAVDRLFRKNSTVSMPKEGELQADVISFQVPSPATLKDVGIAALHALGYPIQSERSAGIIWNRVRDYLRKRETLFLHMDEAQDLYTAKTDHARQSVINTLKSVMQNRDWPVGIILSGMPQVREILNFDPQLARRFYPIELKPLSWISDEAEVRDIMGSYASKVSLSLSTDIVGEDFILRFFHAGANELGLMIDLLLGAIEEALYDGAEVLEARHFTAAFRRKTASVDGLNPFIVSDYQSIDPRKLLGRGFE